MHFVYLVLVMPDDVRHKSQNLADFPTSRSKGSSRKKSPVFLYKSLDFDAFLAPDLWKMA